MFVRGAGKRSRLLGLGLFAVALMLGVGWYLMGQIRQEVEISLPKPLIHTWKTNNGADVLFIETHDLPIVDVALVLPAGSVYDGDFPGLARLTAAMMHEGTPNLNADQVAQGFARYGTQVNVGVLQDQAVFSLRSMSDTKYLAPSLQIFHEVIATPSFPEKAFARRQRIALRSYDYGLQSPRFIAKQAFARALYGQQGYGHMAIGNKEALQKIKLANVRAFYKSHYLVNHAILAIVGDQTLAQAMQLSENLLADLAAGDLAEITVDDTSQQAGEQRIQYPSTQTSVIIGQVGVARNNPDYFPLMVGNHILGVGMTSRLFKVVREEGGLAYDINSRFHAQQFPGPFRIYFSTRHDQVGEAVNKAKQVLAQFIQEDVTEEELVQAKKHMVNSFVFSLATNSGLVSYLSHIGFYRLPLDYLVQYPQQIKAVKLADVKSAFKQRLNMNNMVTILVGRHDKG